MNKQLIQGKPALTEAEKAAELARVFSLAQKIGAVLNMPVELVEQDGIKDVIVIGNPQGHPDGLVYLTQKPNVRVFAATATEPHILGDSLVPGWKTFRLSAESDTGGTADWGYQDFVQGHKAVIHAFMDVAMTAAQMVIEAEREIVNPEGPVWSDDELAAYLPSFDLITFIPEEREPGEMDCGA